MISPAKFFIWNLILYSWQYPNNVTELGTSWHNGTTQNGPLNIGIGRSLMGETKIQKPPPSPQKNKLLASPKGGPPVNAASDRKSGTSNSKTKSEGSQCTKNNAMNEKMEAGTKELDNKLSYPISKNKKWILFALSIIVFYPAALYCLVLFVKTYNSLPPYSWTTCYITVPIFIICIILSVIVGTYYPLKRGL
ncbi:Uncharacterized protein PCOAH_00004730 [Plasmodium coatneyi]|uniref:Uncharacterized protein n=1 Tax=Plasmodium coatneyi TaxID=208452 RepID=A0A1B1DTP5_9APIC|nr:Uncharacterized protein PCOAH_00004730 [Plasmodium coatneyi]ANQ06150.1 Uncharacterized protein PCOAH_00004730 [Plasmodium coatneyi]